MVVFEDNNTTTHYQLEIRGTKHNNALYLISESLNHYGRVVTKSTEKIAEDIIPKNHLLKVDRWGNPLIAWVGTSSDSRNPKTIFLTRYHKEEKSWSEPFDIFYQKDRLAHSYYYNGALDINQLDIQLSSDRSVHYQYARVTYGYIDRDSEQNSFNLERMDVCFYPNWTPIYYQYWDTLSIGKPQTISSTPFNLTADVDGSAVAYMEEKHPHLITYRANEYPKNSKIGGNLSLEKVGSLNDLKIRSNIGHTHLLATCKQKIDEEKSEFYLSLVDPTGKKKKKGPTQKLQATFGLNQYNFLVGKLKTTNSRYLPLFFIEWRDIDQVGKINITCCQFDLQTNDLSYIKTSPSFSLPTKEKIIDLKAFINGNNQIFLAWTEKDKSNKLILRGISIADENCSNTVTFIQDVTTLNLDQFVYSQGNLFFHCVIDNTPKLIKYTTSYNANQNTQLSNPLNFSYNGNNQKCIRRLLPPEGVTIKQLGDKASGYSNIISWEKSPSTNIEGYKILKNGKLLQRVSSDHEEFIDRDIQNDQRDLYSIYTIRKGKRSRKVHFQVEETLSSLNQ